MADYYVDRLGRVTRKKKDKYNDLDPSYYVKTDGEVTTREEEEDDDIAPVAETLPDTQGEERTWFSKGAFSDGYQFGDLSKTIYGTLVDTETNFFTGLTNKIENTLDTGALLIGGIAQARGNDELAYDMAEFIAKDIINEETVAKTQSGASRYLSSIDPEWYDKYSVLGEKSDSLVQSGGQLAGTIGISMIPGIGGALATISSGVDAFGSEAQNAMQQGASYEDAILSATISAGAEIVFEKLSGGIKFGKYGTLDDMTVKKLSNLISNKTARTLVNWGIDVVGEGTEEVLTGVVSDVGRKITYDEDGDIGSLLFWEWNDEQWEEFIGGAVLGGVSSASKMIADTVNGRDPETHLTNDEQAVVDNETASRIAEAEEESGKKLSMKDKNMLRDSVIEDLDKGNISIDTIEKTLAGDAYMEYTNAYNAEDSIINEYKELGALKDNEITVEQRERRKALSEQIQEANSRTRSKSIRTNISEKAYDIAKDSRLVNSYNEKARRSQAFTVELSDIEAKYQDTYKRAMESGVIHNGNRAHELVETLARIEADKGIKINLSNTEKLKEAGHYFEGQIVDGVYDSDGSIILNVDSPKAWQSTVGHEITHALEKAGHYDTLKQLIFDYATSKGDYSNRRASIEKRYKTTDAKTVDSELAADLVGDYLFTDAEFVNNLSTKNRNIFQKIYDEIKYLFKIATAGSKEARQLEKIKREFDRAYNENIKGAKTDGTKNSLSETTDGRFVAVVDNNILSNIDTNTWDNTKKEAAKKAANEALKQFSDGIVVNGITHKVNKRSRNEYTRSEYTESLYNHAPDVFADKMRAASVADDIVVATTNWNRDGGLKHPRTDNFVDFDHGHTLIVSGNAKYSAEVVVGITANGDAVLYDVVDLTPDTFDIKNTESPTAATTQDAIGDIHGDSAEDIIPQKNPSVNNNFENSAKKSLSADTNGRQLTKGQSEYFKDSKVRDENGSLKVMYHGSTNAGFHEFSANFSDDSTSLFFVDNAKVAQSYSGTSETYAARTFNTAEDFNSFFAEIGADEYSVVEQDGKFLLLDDGDVVEDSNTAYGLYEVWRDYSGLGFGEVNYKVYLDIKNPLEIDAEGRQWNELPALDGDNEVYDYIKVVNVGDAPGQVTIEYAMNTDSAPITETVDLYEKFNPYLASRLSDLAPGESIENIPVKETTTRDYAQYAKENGYDGVILKNIYDIGGYGGTNAPSTVAIAFDSNQVKSVANENPTKDADIRYSLSEDVKKAEAHFGTTLNINEAGYLLTDGKFLDMSGKHDGAPGGYRTVDHRDIREALGLDYGGEDYSGGMVAFMQAGNIRLSPENGGINLSVKPNNAQLAALDRYISKFRGEVILDIDDAKGNTIVSIEYPVRTYSRRIINDINDYFDNGTMPEQPSSLGQFRYSLSEDSQGRKISQAVQNRFKNSKAVDEDGNLKVLYHGTASGEFSIFDKAKGNVEGDFGSGFYFTDNEADVFDNYEDGGADFENKVGRRAEQLEYDEGIPYDEAMLRARDELYIGGHRFEVYLNIENPAIVGETILFEQDSYLEQYNEEDYDSYDDYIGDVEQLFADDIDTLVWEIERNIDLDNTDGIKDVLWGAYAEGGIGIEQLKKEINDLYLEDSNGNLVGNEVTRQIIESLGYDGIIDPTVSTKFNMDLDENTTHYIVFKPNQIKDIRNQNPTDNPDIHKSLSDAGMPQKTYGNYSTPLRDLRLETAPTAEDVQTEAPIQEKFAEAPVTETETVADDMFPDDYAPTENSYTLEQELEALGAQFEGLTEQIIEASNSGNKELANKLYSEYQELEAREASLQERLTQMREAEQAEAAEYLNGITDADAPPEFEIYDDSQPDYRTIDEDSLYDMAERISEEHGFDKSQQRALRYILQEYSSSELMDDAQLEKHVENELSFYTEKFADDSLKEVKQYLRTTRIKVSDKIKAEYHKYGDVHRSLFGKIRLSKQGAPVDVIWMDLADQFPGFFPEDIISEQDQFSHLVKLVNTPVEQEINVKLSDGEISKIISDIKSEVNNYKQGELLRLVDEAREASLEAEINQATMEDIAPVAEAFESIRPQRPKAEKQQGYGNRLARRDSITSEATAEDIAPIGENVASAPANPSRRKTEDGYERRWIGTSTESDAVGGKILPDDLDQKAIHYQPISNKVTLGRANANLDRMGYDTALSYFDSQLASKKVSLDDVVLGERLIQEAINRGDTKTAGELIQNVAILGTELGQKVQALSIIKRLTPEGQLGMLQKVVNRGKAKGDKAFEGVEITQEMIDKILSAYGKDGKFDQKKLNKAVEDVKKELADKMKVTKLEKVNAWRYLSMLGNPKTHIRNLVSNVAMKGTMAVKNAIARTIETVAPIHDRTKTWKRKSETVKEYSKQVALEMKDVISGESKYSEAASIKDKRRIFKNKVLNGVYEFNNNMLGKEDWWFSKSAFESAFGEFLTANGINTEADINSNPELIEKAKQYALEQSQIATFRQYSWLANKISEIENKNAFTSMAVGAVLPFKKTPINVAKTGLAYSPLGFAKTLTYDIAKVKKGEMEASQLVDHLSQNLTGTGLTLVGYLLASAGFLNGAGEDDKEGKYDYQLGEQAYSINIGGASYSLSWLSPAAMPLFVGANAYEQLVEGKEWNGDVVVETLAQTLDPLSEMSFLSGLDSVLSSYDSGIEKFAGIGEAMVQNYATQFVPTAFSQVAALTDDTKRTTKVGADSGFKAFDSTLNKIKLKIPGLRNTLEPSTDIWGNEIKQNDNIIGRAFESFIAPYSVRSDISSEIDAELKALYSEAGEDGVIPSIPNNYVTFKGGKYEMSDSDYTEFKKTYGQTSYNLLRDLFNTSTYQNASAAEKSDMVERVYDYAMDEAKRAFLSTKDVEYTNATNDNIPVYKEDYIKGAIENDMPVDEYGFYVEYPAKYKFFTDNGIKYADYANADEEGKRAYTWAYENPGKYKISQVVSKDFLEYYGYKSDLGDIRADKDKWGDSIVGSAKEKKIEYINNLNLEYGQKIILFKSQYPADDTYNLDIVEYLNNRSDISYEQEVEILKELGFRVYSDGRVEWD